MKTEDLMRARWDEYRGNNLKVIDPPSMYLPRTIVFAKLLGKPLNQKLWEDLIYCLQIRGLCIYTPADEPWEVGWGQGHCCIFLGEDSTVKDIWFVPYKREEK